MIQVHNMKMEQKFGGRIVYLTCSCGWRGPNRGYDDGIKQYREVTERDAIEHLMDMREESK